MKRLVRIAVMCVVGVALGLTMAKVVADTRSPVWRMPDGQHIWMTVRVGEQLYDVEYVSKDGEYVEVSRQLHWEELDKA